MRFLSLIAIVSVFTLTSCLSEQEDLFSGQLDKDIEAIDTFLALNNINAIKDISGVRFTIETLGTGYVPRITDKVSFSYSGKILNGSTFQTSNLNDAEVQGLIAGFQIGLTQIPAGSSATLYIPSGYGYGQVAQPGIPANSVLVYTITIKKITVTSAELTRLGTDTVAIDQHVTNKAIADVVKDSTGLRYKITELGTGATPSWYNKVKISYTGYLLTNGEKGAKFYEGSNEPNSQTDSRVVNFIRGFQMGLLKLPKGSKATLFIPSGMGFGTQEVSGGLVPIPINSILIYDIELIDVLNP